METKFKFESQVCTSRVQSERLLSLGLKKETADMCHRTNGMGIYFTTAIDLFCNPNDIPAWSLGRLIELMPRTIMMHFPKGDTHTTRIERFIYAQGILTSDDSIAEAVSIIEWLIKEGYFNKEYLENGK